MFDSGRAKAWMPTGEVRPHVVRLIGAGWSREQIGQASGTSGDSVRRVLAGSNPRVRHDVAQALLKVAGDPPGGRVPSDLTHERVRSLMALGYTLGDVRSAAGLSDGHYGWAWSAPRVTMRVAVAIRDLYAQVGDTPGPNPRTAAFARGRGWVVPAAWDDPGTLVWPGRPRQPRRVADGRVFWDELRWQEVDALAAAGADRAAIAERMGVNVKAFEKAQRRRRAA